MLALGVKQCTGSSLFALRRCSWASKCRLQTASRGLATALVYMNDLPEWADRKMLADTAKESNSKVYGVWISSEPSANRRQRPGKGRKAAIRIVTEDVPLDLGKIAGLPEPSSGEIQELKASVDAVVSSLELHGIGSVPIYKDVSLFQSAARNATVDANASREFDTLTTPRPRYTRGLIDGYRQGFAEARQKRDAMALLKDCEKEQEEDELASLAGYFESRFNQR